MLLQLGCIPQALFWDVTIHLKTSLANGALLFLLSLPFLGDDSSPYLENQPLVSKAGIIWPWQRTCLMLWLSWRCLLTLMSTSGGVSWGPENCEPVDQQPGEPGLPICSIAASLETGIAGKGGKHCRKIRDTETFLVVSHAQHEGK